MASSIRKTKAYEFGSFRIEVENSLLLQAGEVVPLQPKTFDVLLLLVQNRRRVMTKDELMRQAWPDTVVEESNLTQNIYILRKLFSADDGGQKYIETIAKRGYRFVARVNEVIEPDINRPHTSVRPASGEFNVISFPSSGANKPYAPTESKPERKQPKDQDATDVSSNTKPRRYVDAWLPKSTLPRVVLFGCVVLIIGLGAYLVVRRGTSPNNRIRSIAVLPFATVNTVGDDQFLGFGIAEDLTTRLSSTRKLQVRPTSSILRQSDRGEDPLSAGRALVVDAVLTGTVLRAGDRIRVNAQLFRVADGSPIWAQMFNERVTDILTMQDHVSEQLAKALMLELGSEGQQLLTRHYTENAEAYELYLKGHDYWKKRTREGFQTCIDYLQRALQKDPQYSLAYAGLAAAYSAQSLFGFAPPKEAMPQAESLARRALELDAGLSEAHIALGCVQMYYYWNLGAAGPEFERGIELDPNQAESHQLYALYLSTMKRFDDAARQVQAARQLDPGSLLIQGSEIWITYLSRRHDDAITLGKLAIDSDSRFYIFHQHLGFAYVAKGMYEPAIAALQRARILSANAPASLARLGHVLALAGKMKDAHQAIDELEHNAAPAQMVAWVHIGLNDPERAMEWLEKAYDERDADLIYLSVDPIYDRLRSTQRFNALMLKINHAR